MQARNRMLFSNAVTDTRPVDSARYDSSTGETTLLRENPVLIALYPPQI
jgi:hypothetical protein